MPPRCRRYRNPAVYEISSQPAMVPNRSSRWTSASATTATLAIGNASAMTARTGSSGGIRNASASSGAARYIAAPATTPRVMDEVSPVAMWRAVSSRRWISAGPTPRFEKMVENQTTTPAAAKSPKSAGRSSRANTASTAALSTARTALPSDSQMNPPMARSFSSAPDWAARALSAAAAPSGVGTAPRLQSQHTPS